MSNAKKILESTFLIPGFERERAFESHPIVLDTATIPTPGIKAAYDIVEEGVVHRDSGISFTAEFRFGKTFAIRALKTQLKQNFAAVIFTVGAKDHDRNTELSFYTDLLQDCGHGAANLGRTALERRWRLFGMWVAAVQETGQDRIVLFVDEGQNWHEPQLTFLRDLSNDLQRAPYGIRLITVIFAQPVLRATREALMGAHRMDLIGRFMLTINSFRGIASVSDTIELMKALDDPRISEYPANSGISYSQFFRPQAYANGWRMRDEAGACWAEFEAVASRKRRGKLEVGMLWMNGAIRSFLYSYWKQEHGTAEFDGDVWSQAVAASRYETSIV
ncbi:AAA ATPase domain-containing protein [Aromatoleum petrolei]|nr:AAA ATPase domain-containing protein [Aromatoleum petrolei]